MSAEPRSYLDQRHAPCPACRGLVAIPSRRRDLTLDQVMTTHLESCPARGVRHDR